MIRVRAPSRLHFGFLSLTTPERWTNFEGQNVLPARAFGSVGLMIRNPGIQVTVQPAEAWAAEGLLADRALAYAQRLLDTIPPAVVQPLRLRVEHAALEHVGLGTGTQLALVVGRALGIAFGQPHLDPVALAGRLGRGVRSGIGVHGFIQGGFLVEGGKGSQQALPPLLARLPFPESWRLVLVLPTDGLGLHGTKEHDAFQTLQRRRIPPTTTDTLCRLVLLGMMPALAEEDWLAFGEAIYDFNARVGELFAPFQGGKYSHRLGEELVPFIRRQGIFGVGQSSWGPAFFAITPDDDRAGDLIRRIRDRFDLGAAEVFSTQASNEGAVTDVLTR
jgi:beta-RFAP synthase